MTEWPDDWFRDGPNKPAGNAGDQHAPAAPGSAGPTVQLPGRSPGGDAWAGGGGGAGGGGAGGGGAGGWPGGGAGGGWPEQPAAQLATPTLPHRARGFRGIGFPSPAGTGWRRWLRPRRILAILGVLVCLIVVAGVASYFYVDSKLTKINALVPSAATAGQNWLITGYTGQLTNRQIRQLRAGFNRDALSDTILVLHIPGNGDRPTLVSIPRDSYVPIPGHGSQKINAAYVFGGAPLLVQTVQNVTGLHIDHYMGVGYNGFVSVVNAIGGVHICLPGPVVDPKAGINIPKGCHNLTGRQALGFVRTRQFALGDLQRVQDQRILIKAMLKKMTSFGTLINPFAIFPAATGSASALTVDNGTNLYQLIHVAFALKNPVTTTVPFGGFATNAAGSVVLWNTTEAQRLFHDLATDHPVPRSLITGSKVSPTA